MAGEKKNKNKPSPTPKWSRLQGQYPAPSQWTGILVRLNAQCMGWMPRSSSLGKGERQGTGFIFCRLQSANPASPTLLLLHQALRQGQEQKVIPEEPGNASRHCQAKALQGLSQRLSLSLCNSETDATIRLLHGIDLFRGLHVLLQPQPMWTWQEQGLIQGGHSTKSTAANKD